MLISTPVWPREERWSWKLAQTNNIVPAALPPWYTQSSESSSYRWGERRERCNTKLKRHKSRSKWKSAWGTKCWTTIDVRKYRCSSSLVDLIGGSSVTLADSQIHYRFRPLEHLCTHRYSIVFPSLRPSRCPVQTPGIREFHWGDISGKPVDSFGYPTSIFWC